MSTVLDEGEKLGNLMIEELGSIIDGLIRGRQIWLVDSQSLLCENLLEQIRDELLEHLDKGEIKPNEYVESLSRVYQFRELPISITKLNPRPIIVELSLVWNVKL